jgi:hypothetical protein
MMEDAGKRSDPEEPESELLTVPVSGLPPPSSVGEMLPPPSFEPVAPWEPDDDEHATKAAGATMKHHANEGRRPRRVLAIKSGYYSESAHASSMRGKSKANPESSSFRGSAL